MTIFVTGDIHSGAEMARLSDWDATHAAGPGDYLIVAGDFGYPWSFSMDEVEDINWLSSRPYTVLFVDGNHERYDHWEDRPCEKWHGGMTQRLSPGSPIRRLCRGEVFDFDSTAIFTLGGATRNGAFPARTGGHRSCPAMSSSTMPSRRSMPITGR